MPAIITDLQWKYLGNPGSACILSFEDTQSFKDAVYWADTVWRIPWEYLFEDVEGDSIVPNTIVIPADTLKKFQNSILRMTGKFKVTTLQRDCKEG